ncbi:LURP1-related protein domain containing protein [Heracleum sosnowskyi]|uniref:LURP1-related protein domain containing protein n=1 Tax=Heracleum sosnowskyi TaxID=360622 RepID=A0AAD8HGI1_9APIA|nr:LURP1-related protein domain containing protein [Heracleum sosnowskyi]
MGSSKGNMMLVISKEFCSSSEVVFVVRKRPHVVTGGGFVVTNCRSQNVVFRVEGCGVLGKKDELLLRDGDGDPLLLIRRKGGLVEALSIYRQWRGYSTLEYEKSQKPVFRVKEPNYSCIINPNQIKISIDARAYNNHNQDFEIKGYFPDRACSIMDSKGIVIAKVGVKEGLVANNDMYNVLVKPGVDQAFVFGVIAVLDYIYNGSTRC